MPGPWEKYQSKKTSGPWDKYGSTVTEEPPPSVPRPIVDMKEEPKPGLSRYLDYVGEGVESAVKAPGQIANRSREIYRGGKARGGFLGGMEMAEAPIRAEGEAITGIGKSLWGVSTPGLINRMSNKEDPAKIGADMTVALGGYMAGGPKEEGAAPRVKASQAAKEITDAVNPLPKHMESFQRSLGQHLDKITTFAKSNGIDIASLDGLSKAMKGSSEWIRDHYYKQMLGPVKDNPVSIAGRVKGYSGETTHAPGSATLGQLDARLSQVNAELNPKYAKGGMAGQAAVKSAAELNAEAAGIRSVLYPEIAKATGLDPKVVADTRASFGALNELAEKTGQSASKSRFATNKATQGPVTLNPLSSSKHFIADKAINTLRGDVIGKKLGKAVSRLDVSKYELPKAKSSASTPKSRVPAWKTAPKELPPLNDGTDQSQ